MIAVCMPSRGLVQSRTMEDVLKNLQGKDYFISMSHGRSIPDCHNYIINQALKHDSDYVWIVEDDMMLPSDILDSMIDYANIYDYDVVTVDYPVHKNLHSLRRDSNGRFVSAGVGCVLIKPNTLREFGHFSTETQYDAEMAAHPVYREDADASERLEVARTKHGLLDIDFWVRTREIPDVKIGVLSQTVGQYKLVEPKLPTHGNLTGSEYKIEAWRF